MWYFVQLFSFRENLTAPIILFYQVSALIGKYENLRRPSLDFRIMIFSVFGGKRKYRKIYGNARGRPRVSAEALDENDHRYLLFIRVISIQRLESKLVFITFHLI